MPERTQEGYWPSEELLGKIQTLYPGLERAIGERGINQVMRVVQKEGKGTMEAADVLALIRAGRYRTLKKESKTKIARKKLLANIMEELYDHVNYR